MTSIDFPFDPAPAPGDWREVADGILWIRLPLPMKLDHVNIYALRDGSGWAIVDTGFMSKKGIEIWEALLTGPLEGLPVTRVIATHHHPDHIGMAAWLMERFDAPLVATRTSYLMSRLMVIDKQPEQPPETITFYKRCGMDPQVLEQRIKDGPWNMADVVGRLPQGYTRLVEGDTFEMGGRIWDVRTGDGHAPEHLTLWSRNDPIVLSGDQIIPGISSNLGVYPNEPEADPVGDWIASCEKFLPFALPEHLVLPGHKQPFTGLAARLEQLIENHHSALKRLRAHLSEPRSAHGCFEPLFRRRIGMGEYGLALVESLGHLNHLYLNGEVSRDLRDDGAWVFEMRENTS